MDPRTSLDLDRGNERETQRKNNIEMEGGKTKERRKEGKKETVEVNVVHSGLHEINK